MMIRRLFLALAWAGTLAAQTFIQMSDAQFGMFTKNASFSPTDPSIAWPRSRGLQLLLNP